MALLVAGLVLFLGIHLVPAVPALRTSLVARFGERGYKGAFSALSAVGLVVVAIGFGSARGGPVLFAPVPEAVALAPYAMAASFAMTARFMYDSKLRARACQVAAPSAAASAAFTSRCFSLTACPESNTSRNAAASAMP